LDIAYFAGGLPAQILAMFQKAELDRTINCLHCIASHYPPFIDPFLGRLFEIMKKLVGEFKAKALDLVLWRVDEMAVKGELFKRLQPLLGGTPIPFTPTVLLLYCVAVSLSLSRFGY
jgi:hypothetical protein